jgi:hypothetical protein
MDLTEERMAAASAWAKALRSPVARMAASPAPPRPGDEEAPGDRMALKAADTEAMSLLVSFVYAELMARVGLELHDARPLASAPRRSVPVTSTARMASWEFCCNLLLSPSMVYVLIQRNPSIKQLSGR